MPLGSVTPSNTGSGGSTNILIILTLIDKASKQLSQAANAVSGFGKEAKKGGDESKTLGDQFKSLATAVGIAVGAIYLMKEAADAVFDFGEQGASVRQMSESFKLMTESVGSGTDMLGKLQEASRGTIPDFQLMSYAATALAGATGDFGEAMANNLPHLLEIAKAANKANPALGSVDYQFQSLIIGLKRLSPRLIDNTGLQIKLGQAYEEFAKKVGKTREELTSQEQQQALLNATMEAGDRLIEQVGGSADSLTDVYGNLKASTTNLKNEMAAIVDLQVREVIPKITGVIDTWSLLLEAQRLGIVSSREVNSTTRLVALGLKDYSDEAAKLQKDIELITDAQNVLTDSYTEYLKLSTAVLAAKRLISDADKTEYDHIFDLISSGAQLTEHQKTRYAWILNILNAEGKLSEADWGVRNQEDQLAEDIRIANEELARRGTISFEAAQAAEGLAKAQNTVNTELLRYNSIADASEKATKAYKDRMNEAAYALKEMALSAGLAGTVTKNWESGKKSLDDLAESVKKLTEEKEKMQGRTLGLTEDETKRLDEVNKKIAELAERKKKLLEQKEGGLLSKNDEERLDRIIKRYNDLVAERDKLIKKGGLSAEDTDRLKEIDEELGNIAEEQDRVAEATERAAKQFLFEQAVMAAAADGTPMAVAAQLELARALGLIDENSYNAAVEAQKLTEMYESGQITLDEYTERMGQLGKNISDLKSKTINIGVNVHTSYTSSGQPSTYYSQYDYDKDKDKKTVNHKVQAAGGPVYGGQAYITGEIGRELFMPSQNGRILSHYDTMQAVTEGITAALSNSNVGGGGGVNINFYGTQIANREDIEILAYRIADRINRRSR